MKLGPLKIVQILQLQELSEMWRMQHAAYAALKGSGTKVKKLNTDLKSRGIVFEETLDPVVNNFLHYRRKARLGVTFRGYGVGWFQRVVQVAGLLELMLVRF